VTFGGRPQQEPAGEEGNAGQEADHEEAGERPSPANAQQSKRFAEGFERATALQRDGRDDEKAPDSPNDRDHEDRRQGLHHRPGAEAQGDHAAHRDQPPAEERR
jgi:hypothetical protein